MIGVFNSFHLRLEFTHEMENNGCINFLETTIIRSNTSFKFDWFIKPTASGRFIDFASHHPLSQKIASIICLIEKAFYISDKEFLDININKIRNLFLENNYPLKFINKHIHKRLIYLNNKPRNNCNENKVEHRISLPFVDKLHGKVKYWEIYMTECSTFRYVQKLLKTRSTVLVQLDQ